MMTKKDFMLAAVHFSFAGKYSIVFHMWWGFFYRKLQNIVSCIALVGAALNALGMRYCKLEKMYNFSPWISSF